MCGITGPANTQASQITRHQQPSASSTASQGTARGQHTATSSARQSPETIVIGTSLTRGLGAKLNAHGTNATCYMYAGSTILEIRSRIPHVLPSDNQPPRIVIQCGGNDAESQPSNEIIKQYDNLIGDIQRRCPRASIILSKIPQRKKNKDVLNNISRVNSFPQHRATESDGVWVIDVCPQDPALYRKDLVHFNVKGCRVYVKQMQSKLSNFSCSPNKCPDKWGAWYITRCKIYRPERNVDGTRSSTW